MSRNGAGTYTLPSGNPVVSGTTISSTWANTTLSDIATALTQSIAYDGQTNIVANLPMSTYRHTGVGNAAARTDYAAAGQVQDSSFMWCGTAGGTANALTISPTPSIAAVAAGQRFVFKSGASANTSTTTIAISGLSTIPVQVNGVACAGGEILASTWYEILVDASATSCQLNKLGQAALSQIVSSGALNYAAPVTIASATAPSAQAIGAAASNNIIISGTTTQTGFDTIAAGVIRLVTFSGALILTHNATSMILPGSANITTAANDTSVWKSLGSGNWQCIQYTRAAGTALINPGSLSTASGSAPSYSARAFVNFNGTGTVAIYSSGNVSSITDNGVGDYTLNFTTAMSDALYAVAQGCSKGANSLSSAVAQLNTDGSGNIVAPGTGSFRFHTADAGAVADIQYVSLVVYR